MVGKAAAISRRVEAWKPGRSLPRLIEGWAMLCAGRAPADVGDESRRCREKEDMLERASPPGRGDRREDGRSAAGGRGLIMGAHDHVGRGSLSSAHQGAGRTANGTAPASAFGIKIDPAPIGKEAGR